MVHYTPAVDNVSSENGKAFWTACIESSSGYHVIKVEDKEPLKVRKFSELSDKLKQEIKKKLERRKKRELFLRLSEELEAKSKVKRNLDLLTSFGEEE